MRIWSKIPGRSRDTPGGGRMLSVGRGREGGRGVWCCFIQELLQYYSSAACYKSQLCRQGPPCSFSIATVLEIYSVAVAQIRRRSVSGVTQYMLGSSLPASWPPGTPNLTWPDLTWAHLASSNLSSLQTQSELPHSLSPSIPSIPIAPHLNHSLNPSLSTSIRTLVTIVI